MNTENLNNLVNTGDLQEEPRSETEIRGLLRSAVVQLEDAKRSELSLESRFTLAYGASHATALAALRHKGYRSGNRFLVFQCLPHTLQVPAAQWRVLAKAHHARNLAEYEGHLEVNSQLVESVIRVAEILVRKAKEMTGNN